MTLLCLFVFWHVGSLADLVLCVCVCVDLVAYLGKVSLWDAAKHSLHLSDLMTKSPRCAVTVD